MMSAAEEARARAVACTIEAMRRAVTLADYVAALETRRAPVVEIARVAEAGTAALMTAIASARILEAAIEAIAAADRQAERPGRPGLN